MKKLYILTNEQTEWLKLNYSKLGAIECAKVLNVPTWLLHKTARKLEIKLSNEMRSEYSRKNGIKLGQITLEKRQIAVKKIIIDTKDKAYVLGFLWGDGYLNCIGKVCYPHLNILKRDYDVISNTFKCFGDWGITQRVRLENNINRQPQTESYLTDSVMGLFLEINEYKNKSIVSPTKILNLIPDEYKKYWWRGYIDADGCFYIKEKPNSCYQFALAGTYKQDWHQFEILLKLLNIKYTIKRTQRKNGNQYSHVRITSKNEIIKLGDYLYSEKYDGMGLKRKYQKFNKIKINS